MQKKINININFVYNWYTRETQPIGPFVLEGLPLFTIIPSKG
jgi:hypothetical protein